LKEQRKILLGSEDIIDRDNEDIFLNVALTRSFNELEKERFDNNFNIAEQFREERNTSRNFCIYGQVDSVVTDCDNLEVYYYTYNPVVTGNDLTTNQIAYIKIRRPDVFAFNSTDEEVRTWFENAGKRGFPWVNLAGNGITTITTTLNDIENIEFDLQSPIGFVRTTPIALSGKNVYGFKKGKYLIDLNGYDFKFIKIIIRGEAGKFENQLYVQQLVFFDGNGDLVEYGSETVEITRGGNITVVNNNFPFFYDKHWINRTLQIDSESNPVSASFTLPTGGGSTSSTSGPSGPPNPRGGTGSQVQNSALADVIASQLSQQDITDLQNNPLGPRINQVN